jgi:phosphomannomutase
LPDAAATSTVALSPIVTHSGVRGRLGIELTTATIVDATARLVDRVVERTGEPAVIAVGSDARPQSQALVRRVARTITDRGHDVVDFGVAPTPSVKLAARRRGLAGAVVVTASHLGAEWAGLKLLEGDDLLPVDLRELPPARSRRRRGRRGTVSQVSSAAREHAEVIAAVIDTGALCTLAIGLRGGTGAASGETLARLGARIDGGRPAVTLCLDPDGDRLTLIDEAGAVLDPELTLALICDARRPERLVRGADTSRMCDLICGRASYVSRPGELHLLRELRARSAVLAGEGNGGIVIPEVGPARDALAAAAQLLSELAARGKKLSAWASELPVLCRARSTAPCDGRADAVERLSLAAERLGASFRDPEDGVAVEAGDGTWGLIRQSATEPVLRFTSESPRRTAATRLHRRLRAAAGHVA